MDLIYSDVFLKEILDAVAALVFPPVWLWRLEGTLYRLLSSVAAVLRSALWIKLVEQECGWGLQLLFHMKPGTQIGFPNEQHAEAKR